MCMIRWGKKSPSIKKISIEGCHRSFNFISFIQLKMSLDSVHSGYTTFISEHKFCVPQWNRTPWKKNKKNNCLQVKIKGLFKESWCKTRATFYRKNVSFNKKTRHCLTFFVIFEAPYLVIYSVLCLDTDTSPWISHFHPKTTHKQAQGHTNGGQGLSGILS